MNNEDQQKTDPVDPRQDALNNAASFYDWVIKQPRNGVNTPLSRQLKQVIKMIFARAGNEAIAEIERRQLSQKNITPSQVGRASREGEKKAIEERKARRLLRNEDSAPQERVSTAMQDRLRRVALREQLQPTSSTELEGSEGVAEVEVKGSAGETTAPDTTTTEPTETIAKPKPLTATEVARIPTMGAKEILDEFGEARLLLTMLRMQPDFEQKGSGVQLANRLKAKLKPVQ